MIDEVYATLSFGSNLCAFSLVHMNYFISITGSKVKSGSCVKLRKPLKKTSLLVPLCTNDFVLFSRGTFFFHIDVPRLCMMLFVLSQWRNWKKFNINISYVNNDEDKI